MAGNTPTGDIPDSSPGCGRGVSPPIRSVPLVARSADSAGARGLSPEGADRFLPLPPLRGVGGDPGNRGGDGPAVGLDRSECGRGDDGPAHLSPHGPPPDRPSGGHPLPGRFAARAPPLFPGGRPFVGSRARKRRRSAQEKLVSSRPTRLEQGACPPPPSPDAPRGASLEDVPAALRLCGDRQPPDFGRGSAAGASLSAVLGGGARSMSMTVTSGGERNRIGGPQVPVPRLV